MYLNIICDNYSLIYIIQIIMKLFNILCIIIPIILIVMATYELINLVIKGDDKNNKILKKISNKFFATAIIFMLPTIMSVVINMVSNTNYDYKSCITTIKNYNPRHNYKYYDFDDDKKSIYGNDTYENGKKEEDTTEESNTSPTKNGSIVLNKSNITLGERANVKSRGKTYQNNKMNLTANKDVTWSITSGKNIVKVSSNGDVTGLSGGEAIVRATSTTNKNEYTEAKVTVVHPLYINATIKQNIQVKAKYEDKTVYLNKGDSVVVLSQIRHKYNRNYDVRTKSGDIVNINGKYFKGTSYHIDNGYDNEVYENYVNGNGFTSKTKYLIWVNQGTQRLLLFENTSGKWKVVENFKTSTGDTEGFNTNDSGGSTTIKFNLEVRDFASESNVGRAIHMQKEDTGAYFGNTIHVGSLPKNTKGGNSNENTPSSHGCPHVSKAFRDKLYNTYNKGSKNELKGTKVIYY